MSMSRDVKNKFISSYEVIFFFGNKNLNFDEKWNSERFDSCEFAVPQTNFKDTKYHPTQKPLELFKRLIKVGSFKGDKILDPFAGAGTAGIASIDLGREGILIEKDKEYIKIIRKRINGK